MVRRSVRGLLPAPPRRKGGGEQYAFHSDAWNALGLNEKESFVTLKTAFRQGGEFLELLERFRIGDIDNDDIKMLNTR